MRRTASVQKEKRVRYRVRVLVCVYYSLSCLYPIPPSFLLLFPLFPFPPFPPFQTNTPAILIPTPPHPPPQRSPFPPKKRRISMHFLLAHSRRGVFGLVWVGLVWLGCKMGGGWKMGGMQDGTGMWLVKAGWGWCLS